ncbi:MAG TPA: hypothetical protein DEO85_16580 [Maritimibacter sp.]|nr:hypothetical protein [Maritimibacter sp.]
MTERVFPVQPKTRRIILLNVVLRVIAVAVAVYIALDGGGGIWWLLAAMMAVLAAFSLMSLTQRKYVAKVDDGGVTVALTTGKEMHAPWSTIEGHTIDPARRIGAILQEAETGGGRVRVLPVSVRAMGAAEAEELIALMKERLPKLEYRVPSARPGKKSGKK